MSLLSISRITTQNYCRAIFYHSYCVFHLQTGMNIGSGREYNDLYYLDDCTLHSDLAVISPSNTPLQWHHRLAHLFLQKLCQVMPIESFITSLGCVMLVRRTSSYFLS